MNHEYTGALFILVKDTEEDYQGYVLNTDDEINQFLEAYNISPTETNNIINVHNRNLEIAEKQEVYNFITMLDVDFPASDVMSAKAREIENMVYNHLDYVVTNPDLKLLSWYGMEFKLFRALEHARYGEMIRKGFDDVETFVAVANQVLNRRKSRAGKGLEHHLAALFDGNKVTYTPQAVTEGKKRPDFIFPSQEAYHNLSFSSDNIISLAAKTTCKDRWRQVINEANRLRDKNKFLCTLQQGISSEQMDEMEAEKVILVVPKEYIKTYPREKQERIWTVKQFIDYVKEVEGIKFCR